jgi:tryptophanyl-tRNA synthetase
VQNYKSQYEKGKVGDVEVKKSLARVLNEFLEPIRQRRSEFERQPELLKSILKEGNQKTRGEATKTLNELKQKLGFSF